MKDNLEIDKWSSDPKFVAIMEQQKQLIEERQKTIKTGDNVVHLGYIGEFTNEELLEFEEVLKEGELIFSRYDRSGIYQNNLDLFQLVTSISIAPPLLIEMLKGVSSNVVWDTIKLAIVKVWGKAKTKKYNKVIGGNIEERGITFGVSLRMDKNTEFNFELKGDVSQEVIEGSLDKILDFLKEQKPNTGKLNKEYYSYYVPETKQWIKIDVLEAIRKMADEQASKARKEN